LQNIFYRGRVTLFERVSLFHYANPHMKHELSDTIVALSTPPGIGALGIIRLSGPNALSISDKIFFGKSLSKADSHTIHYGKIKTEEGKILDECLASVFIAPRSYTCEDIVEFSCHGSPYILKEIIHLIIRKGARQAKAGEFTLRAFLNGQLDLSQAEAVADLIASDSEASHSLAMNQMRGGFSSEIQKMRKELINFSSLIELELDFGEEDVEFADRSKLMQLIEQLKSIINRLKESFDLGNVLKHGVNTVIAGKPNAGKSTLLNALLNEERAIVSEIPGTTRDTIEEVLNIKGIQFRLIDTAGIRDARDIIEHMGVTRTMEKMKSSAIILFVVDVIETSPENLWTQLSRLNIEESKFLIILNKMDLNPYTKPNDYFKTGLLTDENIITTSAKNNMNIEHLKERLFELVVDDPALIDQTIVSNSRHYDGLSKAEKALTDVQKGIESGITSDFIAIDIRQCLHYLGEITGEISTDDLLDNIFSNFCIGK